jgi:hypothetical protein
MVLGIANNNTAGTFTLQSLDVSLLGAYYSAQTALRTGTDLSVPQAVRGPAAITPWELPEDDRSLERRVNEIRNLSSFINEKSKEAKLAGDNVDAKALFTLYQAFTRLKAIAEYAADKNTAHSARGPLDVLAQKGLMEIQNYINAEALDKLDLVYGAKSNRVETSIGLGRNLTKFVGGLVQRGSKDAPIPGITGTEVFTITISKSGVSEDIAIDLSEISGPVTLNSLSALVNSKIAAITMVNTNGDTVPKYTTRMNVEAVEGGYALAFSGLTGEKVTLSAAVAEPSLILTGTSRPLGTKAVTTGTLFRLDDVAGSDPTQGLRQTIAGQGKAVLEVKEAKADPLNGRSNEVVEKIRQQVSDLFKELEIEKTEEGAEPPAVETTTSAVAVDSQGHVFVVGQTQGDMGNQLNRSDAGDVYLTKYDAAGNVVWQRLLGASGTAEGFSIAIDGNDNVIVAGQVDGSITGKDLYKGTDSFVAKFSNDGDRVWKQQFDTVATDAALAVAVDAAGDIIIAGHASGALQAGNTFGGARDAYVAKLSGADGALTGSTLLGGSGFETAKAVAIAADGNILLASEEDGRAVVRKLSADDFSQVMWSMDLGALGSGGVGGLAVEGNAVYLAGTTSNAGFGAGSAVGALSGGQDGFVVRLDDSGGSVNTGWTAFIGTAAGDQIADITVSAGYVYVAGSTAGQMAGSTKLGSTEAFAAKIDGLTGGTVWTEQIGGASGMNGATGIAFAAQGTSVLTKLGLGPGTIQVEQTRDATTQTTVRPGDHFYIAINGGRKIKITIEEGDTFERLAARINRLSLRYIKAEVSFTGLGRKLKISVKNGSEIQVFAGDGDRDALKSLGLAPTKIFPNEKLFGIDDDGNKSKTDELGGVFGFKLETGLSLTSEASAKYMLGKINDALAEVQRAYRSLYYDPLTDYLKNSATPKGEVPAALSKQLANYQAGLQRLMLGGGMII